MNRYLFVILFAIGIIALVLFVVGTVMKAAVIL